MLLDLTEIKTYVINLKKHKERRRHVTRLLHRQGMTNIEYVPGQDMSDTGVGCTISHAKVFHSFNPKAPFLVVEDDIDFTGAFSTSLSVPDAADCIYLGRSVYGIVPASFAGHRYGVHNGYVCTEYDDDYYRIYNMLGGHCILYVTQQYVDAVHRRLLDYLLDSEWSLYNDPAYASVQREFTVLTPRKLQVFQSEAVGGSAASTAVELQPNDVYGDLAFTHETELGVYPFYLGRGKRTRKIVTVDLLGGLGNTLFMVSTAYAYARANDYEFVVCHRNFIEGHCSDISPHYPAGWPAYWDTVYRNLNVRKLNTNGYCHVHHWEPQGYVPMKKLTAGAWDPLCLHGYFQNVRYFHRYRSDLIALFKSPPEHIRDYIERKYGLSESSEVLIIGVRQSQDYAENDWLLPAEYYINAYEYFRGQRTDGEVHVVAIADDIQWVNDNLTPHIPGLLVVDENANELNLHMSVIQFYIMMLGNHFILSNSSFHWWGAYLTDSDLILSPADHRNPFRVAMPKDKPCRLIPCVRGKARQRGELTQTA